MTYEWPNEPTEAQQPFVDSDRFEARLYGGRQAGKTEALLMAAVRDVNIPNYRALIMAPEYARLSLLIEQVIEWAEQYEEGVEWNYRNQELSFPNGATIIFGYNPKHYSAMDLDFVGIDNVEEIEDGMYNDHLRIRLRNKSEAPKRYRTTRNMPMAGLEMWEEEK